MLLPELLCTHGHGEDTKGSVALDYTPISREELIELMLVAVKSQDPLIPNQVLARLEKAIPGVECPRQIDGIIARKINLVDRLFLREMQIGPTKTFIPRFYRIINYI